MPDRFPNVLFVGMGGWDTTLLTRMRVFGNATSRAGGQASFAIPDSDANAAISSDDNQNIFKFSTRFSSSIRDIVRIADETRPDFVHFLNPSRKCLFVSFLRPQLPLIGDWEDWHPVCDFGYVERQGVNLIDWFMRRHVTIPIVCSKWLMHKFQELGRSDVSYIPYGVPDTVPVGIHNFEVPTAVFMGSFNPNWDLDISFKALVHLKNAGISPNVQFIGSGKTLDYWKGFAARQHLDNVTFTGFLPDEEMFKRLRGAHVLFFPIRNIDRNQARCPYKAYLYAMSGRPVITNRVGEVENVFGDKAIYVSESPESFATELASVMVRPRQADVSYHLPAKRWSCRGDAYIETLQRHRDQ